MEDKNSPKTRQKFYCKKCDYICSKKSDYTKHIMTLKHLKDDADDKMDDKKSPKVATPYFCDCGKVYKHRQGLWKHQKNCLVGDKKEPQIFEQNDIKMLTNFNLLIRKVVGYFMQYYLSFCFTCLKVLLYFCLKMQYYFSFLATCL